jgi:hypothetical protein
LAFLEVNRLIEVCLLDLSMGDGRTSETRIGDERIPHHLTNINWYPNDGRGLGVIFEYVVDGEDMLSFQMNAEYGLMRGHALCNPSESDFHFRHEVESSPHPSL